METPPAESHNSLNGRRTTRSALSEIPTRLSSMSIHELNMNTVDNVTDSLLTPPSLSGRDSFWNVSMNLPSSMISPSPSPDEMVIQQRENITNPPCPVSKTWSSRRRVPTTWSPDIDCKKLACNNHTPVKKDSPSKLGTSTIVLRSTPRKRLLMELSPSPKKASSPKKARLESKNAFAGPLKLALKGLTQEQLIEVIDTIVGKNPELEDDIKDSLPTPDLRPLEEQLSYLKKNIYKSLPSSRLTSKTDSPAYSRAATHLLSFKKCVLEQGRQLVDSQHWGMVMEYALIAWSYVRATPLWDNPPHNTPRRQCFKSLAGQIMMAIKRGTFNDEEYENMERRLKDCVVDCDDIQTCLKHVFAMRDK